MALRKTESTPAPLKEITHLRRISLVLEWVGLFLALPVALYFYGTRWNIHLALWLAAIYALVALRATQDFSWSRLWRGKSWPVAERKKSAALFFVLTAALILLTGFFVPGRMFSFPMQRPFFWLLVMALYPVLSVTPQEFMLRSFFFRRYAPLFPHPRALIAASAFSFAFVHIVFHNPVSPVLSAIAGVIISRNYMQHRSLKWAVIEHAAYGCMVFTVGLGSYFLIGGIHPR